MRTRRISHSIAACITTVALFATLLLHATTADAQARPKRLTTHLSVVDPPSFVAGYTLSYQCFGTAPLPTFGAVPLGATVDGPIPFFLPADASSTCSFSLAGNGPGGSPSWGAVTFVVSGYAQSALGFGQSSQMFAIADGTTIDAGVRYGTPPVSPAVNAQVMTSVATQLPELANANFRVSWQCDLPAVSDTSVVVNRNGPPAVQTLLVSPATGCSVRLEAFVGTAAVYPTNAYVEIRRNNNLQGVFKLGQVSFPLSVSGNADFGLTIVTKTPSPKTLHVSVRSPSPTPANVTAYRLSMACPFDAPTIDLPANFVGSVDVAPLVAIDGSSACFYSVSALNGSAIANPIQGLVELKFNGQTRAVQTLGETSLPLSSLGISTIELVVSNPLSADDYGPVVPRRLLDTRDGTGGINRKVSNGEVVLLTLPPGRADAINLAVTQPDASGYLTVYPCGTLRPVASNLNFAAGQTTANLVLAQPGLNQQTCIYSSATTHLLADLNGTYPSNSSYVPTSPTRILDTRFNTGTGILSGIKLIAGQTIEIPLGSGSVSVVNTTVTEPASEGFLTVYPCGITRPLASNLNFAAGQTTADLVFAQAGTSGNVCIYTSAATHLILDINGRFGVGSTYIPQTPKRLIDTRNGTGFIGTRKLMAGETTILSLGSAKVSAVTFTVTNPNGPGYLTVYPCGTVRPVASSLNYAIGQTTANLVLAQPAERVDRYACVYTSESTDLIADVQGSHPTPTYPP